ncbi:phage holin, lambda family [Pseudomonas sp. NY15364]|uniref:phage holin, lambda family n=1 Tax=Pseudomonas sp. NY15364 TaxID=3400353 RepID=UPI003A84D0E4
MKMDHDPSLWAAFVAWVASHHPQLYAFGLSVAIAVVRVIYGNGGWRQMALEGALCGLATLTLVPLLAYFGLPDSMATFVGGAVGFMGVEKLREYADRIIGKKIEKV